MKYFIDLDGTLLNHKLASMDAVSFMNEIQRRNIEYRIMTNSIKSPVRIVERLKSVGIGVKKESILSPIHSINAYLQQHNIRKAYVVGSALEREQVKTENNSEEPEIIALIDFEKNNVTYNELQKIYYFMQKGVPAIAASGSPYYSKGKSKCLDTGAFVHLFEKTAHISIKILGKPSIAYFSSGIAALHAGPTEITVVGDDWSTDIIGAVNAGCHAILVKTGKYQTGDENKCKPTKVVSKLMDLLV